MRGAGVGLPARGAGDGRDAGTLALTLGRGGTGRKSSSTT